MSSTTLSPRQLGALFDILVHHETYSEVKTFKHPEAIENYGYPFGTCTQKQKDGESPKSLSPLLQLLFTRLVLPIPGLRDLPSKFWATKFRSIMKRFGEADLSDSYDKGTLGSRKRLASAASVIHESVTRGLLTGIPNDKLPNLYATYDPHTAEDLARAWDDVVHHLVYGNLLDELFDHLTKTPNLEGHSPAVNAAVDYAIIYIATFLHHLFVLSAEGPYLLKLIDNVHGLIPYTLVGQTLRLGNAGTMINAMVRLFLAKVSVGAISNFLGFTRNASDGMNLLQRIISLVLEWDASDFRKAVDSIRRSKEGPSESHLAVIDAHLQASRGEHEGIRGLSQNDNMSIIVAILETRDKVLTESLTDKQHAQCLEYYSAQLAIRDREKITQALCRETPDLTTTIVEDGVSVFEPMIRAIHRNVDIRKHINSVENFLTDLIRTSKPKKKDSGQAQNGTVPPSVEDYVALLKRNRQLAYDYLHEFAGGCPELRTTWFKWAKSSLEFFRQPPENDKSPTEGHDRYSFGSKEMSRSLQALFDGIPEDKQNNVKAALDAHAEYLSALECMSWARVQKIIDGVDGRVEANGNMSGPGVYITRWHCLLDETIVTPCTPRGPPRRGKEVKGVKALGKTEAIAKSESWDSKALNEQDEQARPEAPDVSIVVDTLAQQFKDLVAHISSKGLPLN
ncbi:PX-associated-domain-containing protein [Annulohypoxylon truncatum]|uniref:PX-associated-domain-containing protein n=1 Tax=Annulohypoxylon truncatum TaxID=327061 RepID=UPI002008D68B|nr:PX-associated-domain-containing protein [Annulohypoxylon truncatum]KAI1213740.1 PX-associated-domain-containing protein [Annulohypoxylon truncatum]